MDFGLARASSESRLTKTGTLVGTLAYLSPEQVAARDVDGRSDIYSLGSVLYECVAGEPPFQGEAQSVLYRIVHELPQSPRALGADIDEELEAVVLALPREGARASGRSGRGRRRGAPALPLAAAGQRPGASAHRADPDHAAAGARRRSWGATKEFAELQRRLNAALAGECQFVVVAGEPGIGKTRLLDELESARARAADPGPARAVRRAGPRLRRTRASASSSRSTSGAKDAGELRRAPDFSDLAADLLALFPMLAEIAEIRSAARRRSRVAAPARRAGRGQDPDLRAARPHADADRRRQAARPAPRGPARGGGRRSRRSQYIVRRLGPTPTLIVGTYRTTEVDERHPLPACSTASAATALRPRHARPALALRAPRASSRRSSAAPALRRPRRRGSSRPRRATPSSRRSWCARSSTRAASPGTTAGAWNLSGEAGISADALPATIQQAVEKRIERLPEELRDVLSIASVIGKTFDVPRPRDAREGRRTSTTRSTGSSRGPDRGGARVARRPADLLERRRPRRPLRGLSRRASAGRSTGAYAEAPGGAPRGPARPRAAPARPPLLAGRRAREGGGVRPAPGEGVARRLQRGGGGPRREDGARLPGRGVAGRAGARGRGADAPGAGAADGRARRGGLREAAAAARVFEEQAQPARAAARCCSRRRRRGRRGGARRRAAGWRRASPLAREAGDDGEPAAAPVPRRHPRQPPRRVREGQRATWRRRPAWRPSPAEAAAEERSRAAASSSSAWPTPSRSIEPARSRSTEEIEIVANVFETLLATDARGNLCPALCEKWQVLEGGPRLPPEPARGRLVLRRPPLPRATSRPRSSRVRSGSETCLPPTPRSGERRASRRVGRRRRRASW